jgi:hypothetical protein
MGRIVKWRGRCFGDLVSRWWMEGACEVDQRWVKGGSMCELLGSYVEGIRPNGQNLI